MTCWEVESQIPQLLRGELSEQKAAKVRQHLSQCSTCQSQYKLLQALHPSLEHWQPPQPPKDLAQRTWHRIQKQHLRRFSVLLRRFWRRRRRAIVVALFLLSFLSALASFLLGPPPQGVQAFYPSQLIPGGRASVQVLISHHLLGRGIGEAKVKLFLEEKGQTQPLAEGWSDPKGYVNLSFAVPEKLPAGKRELLLKVSSLYGREELRLPVEVPPWAELSLSLSQPYCVPGDRIYLLARLYSRAAHLPLIDRPLTFQWLSPQGEVIWEKKRRTSSQGTVHLSFRWPKTFPTGQYTLKIQGAEVALQREVPLLPPATEGNLPLQVRLSSPTLSPFQPKTKLWLQVPKALAKGSTFWIKPPSGVTVHPRQGTFPPSGTVKIQLSLMPKKELKQAIPALLEVRVTSQKGFWRHQRLSLWRAPTPYQILSRWEVLEDLTKQLSLEVRQWSGEKASLTLKAVVGSKEFHLHNGQGTFKVDSSAKQVYLFLPSYPLPFATLQVPLRKVMYLNSEYREGEVYGKVRLPYQQGRVFVEIYQGEQLLAAQEVLCQPFAKGLQGDFRLSVPSSQTDLWVHAYYLPPPRYSSSSTLAAYAQNGQPTFLEAWKHLPVPSLTPKGTFYMEKSKPYFQLQVPSSMSFPLHIWQIERAVPHFDSSPALLPPQRPRGTSWQNSYLSKLELWRFQQDLWLSLFVLLSICAFYLALWEVRLSPAVLLPALTLFCLLLIVPLSSFSPQPLEWPLPRFQRRVFPPPLPTPSAANSSHSIQREFQLVQGSLTLPLPRRLATSHWTVHVLAGEKQWSWQKRSAPLLTGGFLLPEHLPTGYQCSGYLWLRNRSSQKLSFRLQWSLTGLQSLLPLPSHIQLPPKEELFVPLKLIRRLPYARVHILTPWGQLNHSFRPLSSQLSSVDHKKKRLTLWRGEFYLASTTRGILYLYSDPAWLFLESSFWRGKPASPTLPNPLESFFCWMKTTSWRQATANFLAQAHFYLLTLAHIPHLTPQQRSQIDAFLPELWTFLFHLKCFADLYPTSTLAWGYYLSRQFPHNVPWKIPSSLRQKLLAHLLQRQEPDGSWQEYPWMQGIWANRQRLISTSWTSLFLALSGVSTPALAKGLHYLVRNLTPDTPTDVLALAGHTLALQGRYEKRLEELYRLLLRRSRQRETLVFWETVQPLRDTALLAHLFSRRRTLLPIAYRAYAYLFRHWRQAATLSPRHRIWLYHALIPWLFAQEEEKVVILTNVKTGQKRLVVLQQKPIRLSLPPGRWRLSQKSPRWCLLEWHPRQGGESQPTSQNFK